MVYFALLSGFCDIFEIRILPNLTSRDMLSTTGKNLRTVEEASGLDPWQDKSVKVKAALYSRELVELEPKDMWRSEYLCSLLRQRQESAYMGLDDQAKQHQALIDSLVV